MPPEAMERKLTAILSADVKGYSRLMGEDEGATIRTLNTYRGILTALIQKHRGRVVDATGDNLLGEFSSVVNATECAVEIQKEIKAHNADLPENRRMEFRIGINVGDVIEEGEQIYGDGVNIAARLESLAEGGGICISGTAYEQIEGKLALGYEYLGEQSVKNIRKPVKVYRILMGTGGAGSVVYRRRKDDPLHRRRATRVFLVILVGAAAAMAIWRFYLRPPQRVVDVASVEETVTPFPDKPAIAVLPFDNLSGDPDQAYFSDGMTEEIITALSKVPRLFVIARNSSFIYKGKPVKVQEIGRELGVQYVLEGSVRKAGDRVRITAQLVDATTGNHLWAERYERNLEDVFALQDEITMKVLTALQVKLTEGEQARVFGKGTENHEAYVKVLQGREHIYRMNREGVMLARQSFEDAIAIDSKFAIAYTHLAWTYLLEVWLGFSDSPGQAMAKTGEFAQKALALDDSLADAHTLLGSIYLVQRQWEMAVAEGERSIALNPNSADNLGLFGMTLCSVGRPEDAVAMLEKAIRLNPIPPNWLLDSLASAYRMTGRYENAIAELNKVTHRNPDYAGAWLNLAATHILLGQEEEARAAVVEVLRLEPGFSLEAFEGTLLFKNKPDTALYIDSLRKAGLK
jgi:adenylate cyclase